MTLSLPDYSLLDATLADIDAGVSAAELHGLLCGQLISGEPPQLLPWLTQSLDWQQPQALPLKAEQVLTQMFVVARKQMRAQDYSLQLLLPDDERPMAARLQALAQWCEGLLAGIGLSGIQVDPVKHRDCYEVLGDIANIIQVEIEEDAAADEQDYAEVVEYVRMGVLLLHNQFSARPSSEPLH